MLKLTRKTEYALIALSHMLAANEESVTSSREIAEHYSIPYPLLSKILQELARYHIVEPVQGPRGGYKLQANLQNISLSDFLERLEGPIRIMDCVDDDNCNIVSNCNIRIPIQRINDNVRKIFDRMSVFDITH